MCEIQPERHSVSDNQRILIVDHHPGDLQILRDILRSESAGLKTIVKDVCESKSLAQARDLLADEDFVCVFVNEILPDGDGISLLSDIEQRGLTTSLIILTERPDEFVMLEWIDAGAADYLQRSRLTPEIVAKTVQIAVKFQQAALEKQEVLDMIRIRERAVDAATNGIVIADASLPDCPIVYANTSFQKISGYSEPEIIGRNCRFLQGPETDPQSVTLIREAIRDERAIQVTIRNYRKDCTSFWNEVTISPMCDSMGNVTHYVGIQTDVSARTTSEREKQELMSVLTSEQEQFQAVQDGMADGLVVFDIEGNVLMMNPVALRMHGYDKYSPERRAIDDVAKIYELRNLNGELLPVDQWPSIRALRGERFSQYEVEITRLDTGLVWIGSYSGSLLLDSQGQPYRAILSIRDITERTKAAETVRQFQHLSDNANDEFYLVNSEGQLVYVNAAACSALGYSMEQMLGMHVSVISPIFLQEEFQELFTRLSRESIPPFETLHRRADGTTYPAESSVSILNLGNRHLLFSSSRDISERKATDAKLEELYLREHRIAESLQRSLLTRPPQDRLEGLEVETVYRPAWNEAQVGGDYYDVFALYDGRVALVVGDVSGKGLQAASRTAEIKFTLRAYLHESSEPASALTRLNSFLCDAQSLENVLQEYFVVLSLIVIDPHTGKMEIALAGAEPPMVLSRDGTMEEIRAGGLPLGVSTNPGFKSMSRQLEPGELLLVATDGITEARRGREFLGSEGMARLAQEAQVHDTLAQIGQAILSGAQEFALGRLHDDVCLLLARRA